MAGGLDDEVRAHRVTGAPDVLEATARIEDALQAQWMSGLVDAIAAETWAPDYGSPTALILSWGMHTVREAGRRARMGRFCHAHRHVLDAWLAGTITGGHVEMMTTVVRSKAGPVFDDAGDELLANLGRRGVTEAAAYLRVWLAERVEDEGDPGPDVGHLHVSATLDGAGVIDGVLDAEGRTVLQAGLDQFRPNPNSLEVTLSYSQRNAIALVEMARWVCDHHPGSVERHRGHLNVVITPEQLAAGRSASFVDGSGSLDPAQTAALACDAILHRVTKAGPVIVDLGRSVHLVPPRLWNAIAVRDTRCRFPGCDAAPSRCDAHHVWHWEHGGPTDQDNLVMMCGHHHRTIHKPGWSVELDPVDLTLTVTNPFGHTRTSRPPGVEPPYTTAA